MSKKVITGAVIGLAVLLAVALGFYLFPPQGQLPETGKDTAILNLGITYLPVTPKLSAYYDLGVDSGALVTEVTSGSPADKAGIVIGDVILSFNRARVGMGSPLMGMMGMCEVGDRVELEVWRGKTTRVVELVHSEN